MRLKLDTPTVIVGVVLLAIAIPVVLCFVGNIWLRIT